MIAIGQYQEFMFKLLADQRGRNALNLSEWEQTFVASFGQSHQGLTWFSERRVKSVDRLWRRYGPEMNFPHPLDDVHGAHGVTRPTMAPADPDGCEYCVRMEGVQRRCNEPATLQEPGKLRYCEMHGEAAVKAIERSGRTLRLVAFKSSIVNPKS